MQILHEVEVAQLHMQLVQEPVQVLVLLYVVQDLLRFHLVGFPVHCKKKNSLITTFIAQHSFSACQTLICEVQFVSEYSLSITIFTTQGFPTKCKDMVGKGFIIPK